MPAMQEEKVQPQEPQNEPQEGEKSLEVLLSEAQARIEQQRDSMMRAVAEAENSRKRGRKRVQAEAAVSQRYAVERFAESLLPVVDSLEAALAAARDSPQALREGVELTLRQLKAAFQKVNVAEIAPVPGERFDPHRHQAMAAVPAEADPNTVISVLQKGYALHDRVLRPALVTVTKALENGGKNPISETDLD